MFLVSGGSLAVENAIKAAFDYKVRRNLFKGHKTEVGTKVIHFRGAFHGRSGYTLSMTNTDPVKTFTKRNCHSKFPVPMDQGATMIPMNSLETTIPLALFAGPSNAISKQYCV